MGMQLSINVSSEAVAAIKEMIREQGYEPPKESDLRDALETDLEGNFDYEMQFEKDAIFTFVEWLINNWELKKIEKGAK